jgi:hypothetical protein
MATPVIPDRPLAAGGRGVGEDLSSGAARPGLAGLAVGAVLAPLFFAGSLVRGKRCVHPGGAAYEATLVIPDPPSRLGFGCALAVPGEHRALVRLSRGVGFRPPRPDVHGLALRLLDAGGPSQPQDLLLITATERPSGRHAIVETEGFGPLFSTVLTLRVGSAVARLTALPVSDPPPDEVVLGGGAEGMTFDVHGEIPGGPSVPLAVLHLGAARSASEAEALRFDVWNVGGGIVPVGVLGGARRVVYPASQLGRRLRGG